MARHCSERGGGTRGNELACRKARRVYVYRTGGALLRDRSRRRRKDGHVLHVIALKSQPGGSVHNAEGKAGVIETCPADLPAADRLVQKAVGGFKRQIPAVAYVQAVAQSVVRVGVS